MHALPESDKKQTCWLVWRDWSMTVRTFHCLSGGGWQTRYSDLGSYGLRLPVYIYSWINRLLRIVVSSIREVRCKILVHPEQRFSEHQLPAEALTVPV